MTTHLTEDQITDLLIEGVPAASCQAHLAVCAGCRERVEQDLLTFGSTIEDFNHVTLAWSDQRPLAARAEKAPSHWSLVPTGLAFAAVALAAGIPVWNQHNRVPTPAPAIALPTNSADNSTAGPDRASQIAADNALMQSVNLALAANEPSPLAEYYPEQAPLADPAASAHLPRRSR